MTAHKFAEGNNPAWNKYWTMGYNDAEDALGNGVLTKKPASWNMLLWDAYQDGVYHAECEQGKDRP